MNIIPVGDLPYVLIEFGIDGDGDLSLSFASNMGEDGGIPDIEGFKTILQETLDAIGREEE